MDTQTLTVVLAVGVVALLFGLLLLRVRRLESRSLDTAIAVHLKRHDGGFVAELSRVGVSCPVPAEHGVVWLDERNQARAGEPLWAEQHPSSWPMTLSFTSKQDAVTDTPTVAGKHSIRLGNDEGGGAWIRWTVGSSATTSEALVILWTLERRRRGLPPVILRGPQAGDWVNHFKTPESQPPEPPRVRFSLFETFSSWIYRSRVGDASSSAKDAESPIHSPTAGVRTWLNWILGGLLAVILSLILLDLLGIRRFVPLTSDYDWLAFVGAILGGMIGGLVTFGGVYLTLQHARESEAQRQSAEDLRNRLSILPLFEYSLSYDPKDFDNSAGQLAEEPGIPIYSIDGATWDSNDAMRFAHDLIVRNVGLGHALLRTVTVEVRDNRGDTVQSESVGFANFLVKSASARHIRMYFVGPRNNPRFEDPRQHAYQLRLTLHYDDLLDNGYLQVVHSSIAKGLYADEDPTTGGQPFSSLSHAEPPTRRDTDRKGPA